MIRVPVNPSVDIRHRRNVCVGRTARASLVKLVRRYLHQAYDVAMVGMVKCDHLL